MKKSKITFKLISNTHIEIFNDGEEVGQIYSDTEGEGGKPYPHNEEIPTLESIQICGFTEISPVWTCGIFHGTKDVALRFNKFEGEYYKGKHRKYRQYVNKCFDIGKPQLIKSFNDWMRHDGYPEAYQVTPTIYDAQKAL